MPPPIRRSIFERQFWREFYVDLARSPRDPRSRKSLGLKILGLLYFAGVLAYYGSAAYSFHDPVTALGLGVVIGLTLLAVGAVRFSHYLESRRQLRDDIASTPAEVTMRIQNLALGFAAITLRAVSERWLQQNILPEGREPIARRISIESLKQHGVWDEMPTEARILMMQPDGSWESAAIHGVLRRGEALNSLVWALALSTRLRPVEDFLKLLSQEALQKALEKPAKGLRPSWDLRAERNRSLDYFWRCYAESVHRGDVPITNDEEGKGITEWMDRIENDPSLEMLAGTSTIRELEVENLEQAKTTAACRYITLDSLTKLSLGEDDWPRLSEIVYDPLVLCDINT